MSTGYINLPTAGGVTSVNSETGDVNIVAGTGISVTPSGQNITIAATGGGVTSLNSETGAITLLSGSNVTITPSGQNITISASGGGANNTGCRLFLTADQSVGSGSTQISGFTASDDPLGMNVGNTVVIPTTGMYSIMLTIFPNGGNFSVPNYSVNGGAVTYGNEGGTGARTGFVDSKSLTAGDVLTFFNYGSGGSIGGGTGNTYLSVRKY